ncbi:MAG TPA: hypothetical protein VMV94_12635 [Phycisphaerae bacterium]|nr:hypothetical protein [Phycisphaerae bacterium]
MRALGTTISIVVIGLVAGSSSSAMASMSISYQIHAVPDDPKSPVLFAVTLEVEEADRDGDSVGWEILSAHFERHGQGAATWIKDAPFVATPDGLWWVRHANANAPVTEDFVKPPEIAGTAEGQDGMHDDLGFVLEGAFYDPELRGSPFTTTGSLNYAFVLANAPEPVAEGEDDPVEVGEKPHA